MSTSFLVCFGLITQQRIDRAFTSNCRFNMFPQSASNCECFLQSYCDLEMSYIGEQLEEVIKRIATSESLKRFHKQFLISPKRLKQNSTLTQITKQSTTIIICSVFTSKFVTNLQQLAAATLEMKIQWFLLEYLFNFVFAVSLLDNAFST